MKLSALAMLIASIEEQAPGLAKAYPFLPAPTDQLQLPCTFHSFELPTSAIQGSLRRGRWTVTGQLLVADSKVNPVEDSIRAVDLWQEIEARLMLNLSLDGMGSIVDLRLGAEVPTGLERGGATYVGVEYAFDFVENAVVEASA